LDYSSDSESDDWDSLLVTKGTPAASRYRRPPAAKKGEFLRRYEAPSSPESTDDGFSESSSDVPKLHRQNRHQRQHHTHKKRYQDIAEETSGADDSEPGDSETAPEEESLDSADEFEGSSASSLASDADLLAATDSDQEILSSGPGCASDEASFDASKESPPSSSEVPESSSVLSELPESGTSDDDY
jgi:hypothetical protein